MKAANKQPPGLSPVMLTPFTADKQIDWHGLDRLIDWYVESGCACLFTVCLSSEMYALSPDERLSVAKRVVGRCAGRVEVLASGTFGSTVVQQAEFVRKMADTGVAAVICLVNQLADEGQDDGRWKSNTEALLDLTASIPLGLYECPLPYYRLLTPQLVGWAASTGRFLFLKETSGQLDLLKAKIEACKNTPLACFNANAGTLLESLRAGGRGYSGIAANLYPSLFVWLCRHFRDKPAAASRLQRFLTVADLLVSHKYPASAKQFLMTDGIEIGPTCRVCDCEFDEAEIRALSALREEVHIRKHELDVLDS